MRRYMLIVSAVLLVLSNGVLVQAETSQFDGTWKVHLPASPLPLGSGTLTNSAPT